MGSFLIYCNIRCRRLRLSVGVPRSPLVIETGSAPPGRGTPAAILELSCNEKGPRLGAFQSQYLNSGIALSWSLLAFTTPRSGYHCFDPELVEPVVVFPASFENLILSIVIMT